MKHPNPICPITLFTHADEDRSDRFVEASFFELIEFIEDVASARFERASEARLFAPCEFDDSFRRADHVARSGLVMLDIRRGLRLDEATDILADRRIAAFAYTTDWHAPDRHAFRIGIPVSATVDADTYTRAWQALNRLFRCAADWTRAGAESLFRLPACIGGREAQVIVLSGEVRSAEAWIGASAAEE